MSSLMRAIVWRTQTAKASTVRKVRSDRRCWEEGGPFWGYFAALAEDGAVSTMWVRQRIRTTTRATQMILWYQDYHMVVLAVNSFFT